MLDPAIARAMLKIIEEDRQDVEDLIALVVAKLLDGINLPGPDGIIKKFAVEIARKVAVYVYDLLFELLEEAGRAGTNPTPGTP